MGIALFGWLASDMRFESKVGWTAGERFVLEFARGSRIKWPTLT